MRKNRLDLHEIFCEMLGSRNVYFQPPESVKLKYPCIVYERSYIRMMRADNKIYNSNDEYTVTVITKDPDSDLPKKMLEMQYCTYYRHYVADNLIHDVFRIYY